MGCAGFLPIRSIGPTGSAGNAPKSRSPATASKMDVKFLERIPGTKKRLYQFTAIDDCTRIRVNRTGLVGGPIQREDGTHGTTQ